MSVRVLYSCLTCGLADEACAVGERGPDEDVVHWMRTTVEPALGADHARRSPACRTRSLSEIKIPIIGVSRIGDAVRH